MRTSRSNRGRCTHYLGSNATKLCSSPGGISGSISGKLSEQFEETVLEEVAAASGIGYNRTI